MQDFSSSARNFAPLHVLVVDDEQLIRWSIQRGLTAAGHRVVTAGTAAAAHQCLRDAERPFEVVLLDFRLPDRTDLTLLADVRALSPDSVVLMMSAYAEPGLREEARALGAAAFIDKPFRVGTVVTIIEQCVRDRR